MSDPTYPPTQGRVSLQDQVLGLNRSIDQVVSDVNGLKLQREVWSVPVRNRLLADQPGAAPAAASIGPGNLTGEYEYAFSYESPYLHGETLLSAEGSTALLAGEEVQVTGARSTDPQMAWVNIYRRAAGEGPLDWKRVGRVANPTAGGWSFDDNTATSGILSEPTPLTFYCPLGVIAGPNRRLRRVPVKPLGDLEADPDNYWSLWLLRQKQNQKWPERISRYMDTTLSGMSAQRLLNPFIASPAGPPRVDLDFALEENDALYLGLRGVGAPDPLPELSVQVEVTRQEN